MDLIRDRRKVECLCKNDPEKCICWKNHNKNGPRTWYSGELLERGTAEMIADVKNENGICKSFVKQKQRYSKKKQRIVNQYRINVPKEDTHGDQERDYEVTKREVHWTGSCGRCSGVIAENMAKDNLKEFGINVNKDEVKRNEDLSAYGDTEYKSQEAKRNKKHKNKSKRKRRVTDWKEQGMEDPDKVNKKDSCNCDCSRCAKRIREDKIRDRQKKLSNWQPYNMYKNRLDSSESEEVTESDTEESVLIEGCRCGKKATNERPSYNYKSKRKGKASLPNEFQEDSDDDLPSASSARKSGRNYGSQSTSKNKLKRSPIENYEINGAPYNDQTSMENNQSLKDQDNEIVNQKVDRSKRLSDKDLENENHQNKSIEQEPAPFSLKTIPTKQKHKICCHPHPTALNNNERQASISEILGEHDEDNEEKTCCSHNNIESCSPKSGKQLSSRNEYQKESTSYYRESKPTKISEGPVTNNHNSLAHGPSLKTNRDHESLYSEEEQLPTYDESGVGDEKFYCYKDCYDQTYPEDTSPENNNEYTKNNNRHSKFEEELPVIEKKRYHHSNYYKQNKETTSPDSQKIRGSYSYKRQSRSPGTNQDLSKRDYYHTNQRELSSQRIRDYSRQTRFEEPVFSNKPTSTNQKLSKRSRRRHHSKRERISPDERNADQRTRGDFIKKCGRRHIDCLPDEDEDVDYGQYGNQGLKNSYDHRSRIENSQMPANRHLYEAPSTDHLVINRRYSSNQALRNGYDYRSRIEKDQISANRHFYKTPSTDHFVADKRHFSNQGLKNGYDHRSRIEENQMPPNKILYETPYETPSTEHFLTDRRHSSKHEMRNGYEHQSKIKNNQMPTNNNFYTPSFNNFIKKCGRRHIDCLPGENLPEDNSANHELSYGYGHRSRTVENQIPPYDDDPGKNDDANNQKLRYNNGQSRIEENQMPTEENWSKKSFAPNFIKKCGRRHIDCSSDNKIIRFDPTNQELSGRYGHRSRNEGNQMRNEKEDNESFNEISFADHSIKNCGRRHIDCVPDNKIIRFDSTNEEMRDSYGHRSRNEGNRIPIDESLNKTPFTDHSIKKCGRPHVDCFPDEKVPDRTASRNNSYRYRSQIKENQMFIPENWNEFPSTSSTNHIIISSNRQHVDRMPNQNLQDTDSVNQEHYKLPNIEYGNTSVSEHRNEASRLDQETKRNRRHHFNYLSETGNEFQLSLGNWEANTSL